MKLFDTATLLGSIANNPISKEIVGKLASRCPVDQKSYLEVGLDIYLGKKQDACLKCKASAKSLGLILDETIKSLDIPKDALIETFQLDLFERGLLSVLKGISKFGVRKSFVSGAPFLVVWDITNKCNLNCKHCYSGSGKSRQNELSISEVKIGIDKLYNAGVSLIAFSGGEPLMRKDFFEILQYCKDIGMAVSVASNGTLITREVASKLKDFEIWNVQISLDGKDEYTHDSFRGVNGAFNRTVEGIKNVVEAGIYTSIATTVTNENIEDVPELIKFVQSLGAQSIISYNFIPTGRGKFIVENDIAPKDRENLLKFLYKENKCINLEIVSTAPQFGRVALQEETGSEKEFIPTHFFNTPKIGPLEKISEFIGGCGAGRLYCAIRANGDIDPCVFMPITMGNILTDDFEKIWGENEVLNNLREKEAVKGNCGKCDYRHYCGGCRARAYAYCGDYMAPDPGCKWNSSLFEQILNESAIETGAISK
jgi:radical SAM protein with 4Fe4S-binding SPASM domain